MTMGSCLALLLLLLFGKLEVICVHCKAVGLVTVVVGACACIEGMSLYAGTTKSSDSSGSSSLLSSVVLLLFW